MGAHSENEETPHKTPADYNDISQVGENAKEFVPFSFSGIPVFFQHFCQNRCGQRKKILTFS